MTAEILARSRGRGRLALDHRGDDQDVVLRQSLGARVRHVDLRPVVLERGQLLLDQRLGLHGRLHLVDRREEEALELRRRLALLQEALRRVGGLERVQVRLGRRAELGRAGRDVAGAEALRDHELLDRGGRRAGAELAHDDVVVLVRPQLVGAGLEVVPVAREHQPALELRRGLDHAGVLEDVRDLVGVAALRDAHGHLLAGRDVLAEDAVVDLLQAVDHAAQQGEHDDDAADYAEGAEDDPPPRASRTPWRRTAAACASTGSARLLRRGWRGCAVLLARRERELLVGAAGCSALAIDVVNRSSSSSIGIVTSRRRRPTNARVASACAPRSPEGVRGSPTTIPSGASRNTIASNSAMPAGDPTRSTIASGRASAPDGSLTATPVRAGP